MRVTKKMLEARISELNNILRGSDTPKEFGPKRAYYYTLDCAYGGYKLNRYCSNGSGESDVSYYRMTVRELYYVVNSMVTMLRHEINTAFDPSGLTMLYIGKGIAA